MSTYPFGNDPAKIAGYQKFWQRADVKRPLIGFSFRSWFPFEEYAASRAWQSHDGLTPDMIDPEAFMDDQEHLLREGETLEDDILRGALPVQAVRWECGILGVPSLRILPGNTMPEDQTLPWERVMQLQIDPDNPWFKKYIEFADTLVTCAKGRFPVSHGTLLGPTDLLAVFRGHTQSLVDLIDDPEKSKEALWHFAEFFKTITETLWQRLPRFCDGYFDAQYQLWTAGPIIRMQEDAVAVYSPKLYRQLVQPIDQYLAKQFANSFMHLHSTSMFLLDDLLAIEGLQCFEINYEVDSGGPDLQGMLPYFQRVQAANRSLLIRGSFSPDEARMLMDQLDPRGLYMYVMVKDRAEVEQLCPIFGL